MNPLIAKTRLPFLLPGLLVAAVLTFSPDSTQSKYVWHEQIEVHLYIQFTEQEITSLKPDSAIGEDSTPAEESQDLPADLTLPPVDNTTPGEVPATDLTPPSADTTTPEEDSAAEPLPPAAEEEPSAADPALPETGGNPPETEPPAEPEPSVTDEDPGSIPAPPATDNIHSEEAGSLPAMESIPDTVPEESSRDETVIAQPITQTAPELSEASCLS